MTAVLITGSAGLIGSEAARFFASQGLDVVGIDNDMRQYFFGPDATTSPVRRRLEATLPSYTHRDIDIRNGDEVNRIFAKYDRDLLAVIHTAAQPSHDWAAREPFTDFGINATGTLNLLEATRNHAPGAAFIFTSTNKVYGDTPNRLPLVEHETRWEPPETHPFAERGIDESMSIDHSMHSLFGASKAAADLMVQEYGRYFGMNTACFRGGCLTGPNHAGAELHGFLAYLVKCAVQSTEYTVFGYGGKQVRDNIHASDLINAFWHYFNDPRPGEAYNIGGGRFANCSVLEAITMCEERTGRPMSWAYSDKHRQGDHIWWISDTTKFRSHYPTWDLAYDIERTIDEIYEAAAERHGSQGRSVDVATSG